MRHQVLRAVAHQFPIIGDQLTGSVQQLRRASIIGPLVGLAVLIWGATGLAQAGLFTMQQAWNLPGPARPGYFPRLGRSLVFLAILGAGVAVTTLLTSLGLYGHASGVLAVAGDVLVPATNVGIFSRRDHPVPPSDAGGEAAQRRSAGVTQAGNQPG